MTSRTIDGVDGPMTPVQRLLAAQRGQFANPWHDEEGKFAPKGARLRRNAQSVRKARELADALPKDTGDRPNGQAQAMWMRDDGSVDYYVGDYGTITPEQVQGIHPVDLMHALGNGYADYGVGLDDAAGAIKHLTGFELVFDERAYSNGEGIGAPAPNGMPNFYWAAKGA